MIKPLQNMTPPHVASPSLAAELPGAADPAGWDWDQLPEELGYFRDSAAYRVELPIFEGPLDLLLYLIQKDHLDIYDIPIAKITDQFLQYLQIIKMLPLDNAGDFLVMAATLLRIKARLLLPVQADEEITEEDPRAELVRRLLEYKRFKEVAGQLQLCEEERRRYHLRQTPFPFLDQLDLAPPLRIEVFDLLSALAGIFDRLVTVPVHQVAREPFTVEQKIALIMERLDRQDSIRFEDLFAMDTIKMEVIVTFIAILELVKRGRLSMFQTDTYGAIWLKKPTEQVSAGGDPLPAQVDPARETGVQA